MRLRSRITDLIDRWRKPAPAVPIRRTIKDSIRDSAGWITMQTVVLFLQLVLWFLRRDSK